MDNWQQEILFDFTDWLGKWLGAVHGGYLPSYEEPRDLPSPSPNRIFYPVEGGGRDLAIWICSASENGYSGYSATIARMRDAQMLPDMKNYEFVLASPDDLCDPVLGDVSIWDAKWWLERWESHTSWSRGIALLLKRRLRELPPGKANGAAQQYEVLVKDVFRFLFFPGLFNPRLQSRTEAGGLFRDIIFGINPDSSNLWNQLGSRHQSSNLVIEAKNYQDQHAPAAGAQLAYYLNPYTPGNLGVLVSREGPTKGAWAELRNTAKNGKAILPMSDKKLVEMIDADMGWNNWSGGAKAVVLDLYSQLSAG